MKKAPVNGNRSCSTYNVVESVTEGGLLNWSSITAADDFTSMSFLDENTNAIFSLAKNAMSRCLAEFAKSYRDDHFKRQSLHAPVVTSVGLSVMTSEIDSAIERAYTSYSPSVRFHSGICSNLNVESIEDGCLVDVTCADKLALPGTCLTNGALLVSSVRSTQGVASSQATIMTAGRSALLKVFLSTGDLLPLITTPRLVVRRAYPAYDVSILKAGHLNQSISHHRSESPLTYVDNVLLSNRLNDYFHDFSYRCRPLSSIQYLIVSDADSQTGWKIL